jgi:transcriptional regulator with GAF, ATPase, and Fis domain
MNRVPSPLSRFARLVVETDDSYPFPLAERSLEVVMALVNGRSAGVFATRDDRLTLFASRGIDQHVLDAVETIWRRAKPNLRQGQPVYVPDCATDAELAQVTAGGPASLAMFPVFDGDLLVALFYVDSAEPDFCEAADVERLAQFSAMLGRAVRPESERTEPQKTDWETYLERTPVEDIGRQKLLLLLNRNEWNIARVARLMGVTRRTIYLRLQRYNIPRERVHKSRLRPAAAS